MGYFSGFLPTHTFSGKQKHRNAEERGTFFPLLFPSFKFSHGQFEIAIEETKRGKRRLSTRQKNNLKCVAYLRNQGRGVNSAKHWKVSKQ